MEDYNGTKLVCTCKHLRILRILKNRKFETGLFAALSIAHLLVNPISHWASALVLKNTLA
jgi:hypothetical protein